MGPRRQGGAGDGVGHRLRPGAARDGGQEPVAAPVQMGAQGPVKKPRAQGQALAVRGGQVDQHGGIPGSESRSCLLHQG